jgi:pyridoxamine 5'-phosphate oxidase family protein
MLTFHYQMVKSIFTQKEIEYLKFQRLARIATAAASTEQEGSAQPDVVPAGFNFDGEYLYVGGMNLLKSTKFRDVLKNNKVTFGSILGLYLPICRVVQTNIYFR